MAEQLTAMYGSFLAVLLWMTLAMSSFPVPLSPWMSTVARLWETTPIVLKISRMARVAPMMSPTL